MRIRSIKPEFWRSEDITSLSVEDRLLFIGLWSYVDDNGVGRDELPLIIGDLFASDMFVDPRETVARVSEGLARFAEVGLVARYTVAGRPFLHITNWDKHQRIDHAAKGRYPGPDQADCPLSRDPRETFASPRELLAPGAGEQGSRGAEEQGRTTLFEASSNERPAGTEIELAEPRKSPAPKRSQYPDAFEEFWTAFPRHEGKRKALAAWQAACRRVSPAALLDGARRYAADPNREDAYTAHPTTWLNRDGWDDAPLPKRRPESQQDRLEQSTRETLATLHRMGVA